MNIRQMRRMLQMKKGAVSVGKKIIFGATGERIGDKSWRFLAELHMALCMRL